MTNSLDARIAAAIARWRLTLGEQLTGGTRSAVYAASDASGREMVLKLPATRAGTRPVTADEAAALAVWAGTGAPVRMIDCTDHALLLVRSRPGTLMPSITGESLDEYVGVAAELLGRLWSAPAGDYPFPTLAEVYPDDERVAREDAVFEQRSRGEPERGVPGLVRLPAAAAAAAELIRSAPRHVLLHGDFITKNLITDDAAPVGWSAIDPLPMIGEPAAEVAAFAAYQPAELILQTAEALAVVAGVDPGRAARWAAIWTVHQAAQAWRDDQQQLEELVGSAAVMTLL